MTVHVVPRDHRVPRWRRNSDAATAKPTPAKDVTFDHEYWVAHCDGYRVDGVGGRIGSVEEVRVDPALPSRTILSVRAGVLGRRIVEVSSDEIEFIVPRAQRIWIRTPHTILGSYAA